MQKGTIGDLLEEVEVKKCTGCHKTKKMKEFNQNITVPDGKQHICKDCQSIQNKKYNKKRSRSKKTQQIKNLFNEGYFYVEIAEKLKVKYPVISALLKEMPIDDTIKKRRVQRLVEKRGWSPQRIKSYVKTSENQIKKWLDEPRTTSQEKKKCNKCEKIKSIEDFHKDITAEDGHRAQCKECRLEYLREYSKKKHEEKQKEFGKSQESKIESKRCSICGKIKSMEDFNRNQSRPDGHRSECRECQREKKEELPMEKDSESLPMEKDSESLLNGFEDWNDLVNISPIKYIIQDSEKIKKDFDKLGKRIEEYSILLSRSVVILTIVKNLTEIFKGPEFESLRSKIELGLKAVDGMSKLKNFFKAASE